MIHDYGLEFDRGQDEDSYNTRLSRRSRSLDKKHCSTNSTIITSPINSKRTTRTHHVKLKEQPCVRCNSFSLLLGNKLVSDSSSTTVILGTFIILITFLGFLTTGVQCTSSAAVFSNQFAVHIPGGSGAADAVAHKYGFVNLGQIGSLENYYLLDHPHVRKRSTDMSLDHHQFLTDEPEVHWFEQQVEKKRIKRDFAYFDAPSSGAPGTFYSSGGTQHSFVPKSLSYNGFIDPLYKEQWYLTGGSKDGFDMNVQAAWKRGFSGKGVTVSILDDGIQTNHPDLILNYDPRASTDINGNDNDPTPQDNGDNKHGTRCAGEVAATAGNNICGVGVAFNASIGGVRMLDGTVNDAVEAKALGLNPDHIDIYSASWGPEDDGKTVDGPGPLARRAFIYGVTNGRRGLGSIFIWASGNGGRHVDSCNCDGYTNSIFTLSISSATQGGYKPWYLEECASTLATTYSSGTPTLDKSVATVDMDGRLRPDHICTVEHTGTSASAPLAAGIAALALEANRNLSWRDMQHLVVLSSRSQPLEKEEGWFVNGVKRKFSHKFGYGLMDAGAIVDLATNWAGVPPQHICKSREIREDREIPGSHLGKVKVFMDVDGCAGSNSEIKYLEHVQCKISLRFFPRGNLRIQLTSPMGTTSVLLFERPRDVSSSNFDDWPFLSVHFWGEQAHGRWTLEIINSGSRRINQPGILKKWQLILYGTDVNPARVKSRSYPIHTQPQRFESPAAQTHPIYRHAQPIVPRYHVPDEFIYPGASDNVPQYSRQQSVRAQCQNDFWVPDLSICVNACPEGYFVADTARKECHSCSSRCKSCYNSTSCTACEHNLVLFDTSCVTACPESFFEADSSCEKCPLENCATCAGPMGSECVKCNGNRVLYNNQCLPECPVGYRSTKYNECVECSSGCLSCDDNKCLQCRNGFEFRGDENSCVRTSHDCPDGLYLDSQTNQCIGCGSEDCLGCEGVNACIECRKGLMIYRGECAANCGEGLYTTSNAQECLNCPTLCKQCESPEVCTECREDAIMQDGRCLAHCSEGYYKDAGACVKCSNGCKTCLGQGISDCVSCVEGYNYSRAGVCVSNSNYILKDPQQSTDISCSDGYWLNKVDNSCLPCHSSCSKCTGGNPYNCRSCVPPLRLDRGSSRCIECCQGSNNEDCCHCEAKRHTETLLTRGYNGECHFVSRRVSESVEAELSSGKWSDSSVLSFFWLAVFIVITALAVVFHRRRKTKRISLPTDFSNNSAFIKTFDKSFYTQMNIRSCDTENDNSESYPDSLHQMSLEDESEDDEANNYNETTIKNSEMRPLVLNT